MVIVRKIFLSVLIIFLLVSFVLATPNNQTHPAKQITYGTFDYGDFVFRDNVTADWFKGNGSELSDLNRSVIVNELNDNRTGGDVKFGGNITLGDKVIFRLGEYIDNLVDDWIRITGNLNTTGNITSDWATFNNLNVTGTSYLGTMNLKGGNITADNIFGYLDNFTEQLNENRSSNVTFEDGVFVNNRVGVGTTIPRASLEVDGDVLIANSNKLYFGDGDGIQNTYIYSTINRINYFGAHYFTGGMQVSGSVIYTQGNNFGISFFNTGSGITIDPRWDQFHIRLSEGVGRQFILGDVSNQNYAHPLQDNPTLFIHAEGNPYYDHSVRSNWIGFSYSNVTKRGRISVGNGTIALLNDTEVLADLSVVGNVSVTGNITSENVFIPQYIFSHTNRTQSLVAVNVWTNVTFDQEVADIFYGISHVSTDDTNHTFTVMEDGIYEVDYDFDVTDSSGQPSDIDVAGRLVLVNGTEIIGSVFETDITKQGSETELSHDFLIRCLAGEQFKFQFVADNADVQISTHGTFGDHPESATIVIKKVANL